jgi:hypothetical protein
MHDIRTIIALSIVALILIGGIGVLAVINPYAALGLAPVLMAVAVIVRAISGDKDE